MHAGPHLVGRDQADVLGQPGQAVRVVLVRPALRQGGVQEGTDRLGVRALWCLRRDAAQGGVDGEAADAPLTGRGAQHRARGEPQMCEALAVSGGHRLGDLVHELVGLVHLEGARGEQRGQLRGIGQPFVHHVHEVVLLDRVQDLDEARVAEQRRRACRREDGSCPRVVRGEQVHPDSPAELLVHRAPAAESVQPGDALLQAIASREFVTAVQLGGVDEPGLVETSVSSASSFAAVSRSRVWATPSAVVCSAFAVSGSSPLLSATSTAAVLRSATVVPASPSVARPATPKPIVPTVRR